MTMEGLAETERAAVRARLFAHLSGAVVALAKKGGGTGPPPDPGPALLHARIRGHLAGMLVAPAMVALARGGILARLTEGPLDLRSMSARAASVGCLFDLLSTTGWV